MTTNNTKKNILITTGVYPPKIGGPAQYAKNLAGVFERSGYRVRVRTYTFEEHIPVGIRHIFFFFKSIPAVVQSDIILALDTFSVGLPTVLASKICGKKCVIRTGGDFLWEHYVERTGKKILLKDFYQTETDHLSLKEKMIFRLTCWTLYNASHIVFSTQWQRDIFTKAYGVSIGKTSIIENYYGPKMGNADRDVRIKTFVAAGRNIQLKNIGTLKKIFNSVKSRIPQDVSDGGCVDLLTSAVEFDLFMEKVKDCYAVINVSLSEISPNIILDAIRYNKPFICTREVGIYEKIKGVGIFVDPLNEKEIEDAIVYLLNRENYEKEKEKIRQFDFIHTWEDIGKEFLEVFASIH